MNIKIQFDLSRVSSTPTVGQDRVFEGSRLRRDSDMVLRQDLFLHAHPVFHMAATDSNAIITVFITHLLTMIQLLLQHH